MASPNAFPQSPQKTEVESAPDLPNADGKHGAVGEQESLRGPAGRADDEAAAKPKTKRSTTSGSSNK